MASLLSCRQPTNNIHLLGLYDISKDDKKVVFSYVRENSSSIYIIDLENFMVRKIVAETKDSIFLNPKYSKNNDKILFLGHDRTNLSSTSLYLSSSNGSNKVKIAEQQGIITEAFFSACGNEIYFSKASTYGHYSILGNDQSHDVDIYSINTDTKQVKKISNLKAYGIYKLSEYDCEHFLFYAPIPRSGGMVIMEKNPPQNIKYINPINNPRMDFSMYDSPIYSKKSDMIAFIATYQLLIMSMDNKISRVVVDHAGKAQIENLLFYHTKEKILYSVEGEDAFYKTDFDGLQTTKIPIRFK